MTKKLLFKVGDVLIRKYDLFEERENTNPNYKKGVKLKILRITPRKYYYMYIDSNKTGNDVHENIHEDCIPNWELASTLYA